PQGSSIQKRSTLENLFHSLPVIEPFYGKIEEDAIEWIKLFEAWAKANGISDEGKCFHLLGQLRGSAKTWADALPIEEKMQWKMLTEKFQDAFVSHQNKYT